MITEFPDVDVLYGNLKLIGNTKSHGTDRMLFKDYYGKSKLLLNHLFYSNRIPNPGVIVKKSIYEIHGAYDPNFKRLHDYEFWIRIAPYITIKHCRKFVCKWRWHDSNMSSGSVNTDKKYNYLIVENFLNRYTDEEIFPYLKNRGDKKQLSRYFLDVGAQYAKAFTYIPAVQKAIQYLIDSIHLSPGSRAFFELMQMLTLLPQDIAQELRRSVPAGILERAAAVVKRIKGKSYAEKYKIASLNKRMGNNEVAEKKFQELINLIGNKKSFLLFATGAHFHMGELLLEQNRVNDARSMFEKTLHLNSDHRKAKEYLNEI
jgi:tetratricopeptide (TPR) repeat protein